MQYECSNIRLLNESEVLRVVNGAVKEPESLR